MALTTNLTSYASYSQISETLSKKKLLGTRVETQLFRNVRRVAIRPPSPHIPLPSSHSWYGGCYYQTACQPRSFRRCLRSSFPVPGCRRGSRVSSWCGGVFLWLARRVVVTGCAWSSWQGEGRTPHPLWCGSARPTTGSRSLWHGACGKRGAARTARTRFRE